MIIRILIKYLMGYIRITVEGYYIERFINICKMNSILVWNVKKENSVKIYLNTGIKDFKKMVNVARKTRCKIKIKNKRGIPFLLQKYKKRKLFAILLIVMFSIKTKFNQRLERKI